MAKLKGEVARGRRGRDFVMLDTLCRADQCEIGWNIVFFLSFADDFFAFFDQTRHAFAGLGAGRSIQDFQAFVKPSDLLFGLLKVSLLDRFCSSDVGPSGGRLFHSHECRRKAEEADELAQKATDSAVRLAYEEIARHCAKWRAEGNNW